MGRGSFAWVWSTSIGSSGFSARVHQTEFTQRETEEKARQPEKELGATANALHNEPRNAKRSQNKSAKTPTRGAKHAMR
jgi:hypothetical protein